MKIPGLKTLRRTFRQQRSYFQDGALVLLYHRVTSTAGSDPYRLEVAPQNFDEQMEMIRRFTNPLSLSGLAELVREGNVPRHGIVLTFDDGYADNLLTARTILERWEIPATLFISTAFIDHLHPFWWDELDSLIPPAGGLPDALSLSIGGKSFTWEVHPRRLARRTGLEQITPSTADRRRLLARLHSTLRLLEAAEQQAVLDQLASWAGILRTSATDKNGDSCGDRPLTSQEISTFSEGSLFDVGAHTVSHAVLSALPPAKQRFELEQSKATLERLVSRPVTTMSYPYGMPWDIRPETTALARQTGYVCACTSQADIVARRSDLYRLPRLWVHNWDGDTFLRHIRQWLHKLPR